MATDSTDNSANIDDQIAYHLEMEHMAMKASDFTKVEHHRKMREILESIKEKPKQPYKTPEQLTDEDYKVAPTSADKDRIAK
jgi:hemerythrin